MIWDDLGFGMICDLGFGIWGSFANLLAWLSHTSWSCKNPGRSPQWPWKGHQQSTLLVHTETDFVAEHWGMNIATFYIKNNLMITKTLVRAGPWFLLLFVQSPSSNPSLCQVKPATENSLLKFVWKLSKHFENTLAWGWPWSQAAAKVAWRWRWEGTTESEAEVCGDSTQVFQPRRCCHAQNFETTLRKLLDSTQVFSLIECCGFHKNEYFFWINILDFYKMNDFLNKYFGFSLPALQMFVAKCLKFIRNQSGIIIGTYFNQFQGVFYL